MPSKFKKDKGGTTIKKNQVSAIEMENVDDGLCSTMDTLSTSTLKHRTTLNELYNSVQVTEGKLNHYMNTKEKVSLIGMKMNDAFN